MPPALSKRMTDGIRLFIAGMPLPILSELFQRPEASVRKNSVPLHSPASPPSSPAVWHALFQTAARQRRGLSPRPEESFFGDGGVGEGAVFTKKRPFPHKNKKGRKKENSSGRAAPKAAPHCLPACASGAGSRLWRNMVCAVRPSPQKDARQGAMAKIQSVPVPARKDRHGTGPNPRHRAAAAGAGTGRPSGRPPRPGPWR